MLVLSRGDDDLLRLEGQDAWHFPRDWTGGPLTYPTSSSLVAIADLQALRAKGAEFLVVPHTGLGWLSQYEEFDRYVRQRYEVLVEERTVCSIFRLTEKSRERSVWAELERTFAACEEALDREPALLDWDTGLDLAAELPERTIFAPLEEAGDTLPYLDGTIDLVALPSSASAQRIAEARRVATAAVVTFDTPSGPDESAGFAGRVEDRPGEAPCIGLADPAAAQVRAGERSAPRLAVRESPGLARRGGRRNLRRLRAGADVVEAARACRGAPAPPPGRGPKAHEFRKFLELPRRGRQRFELALDIHPGDARDRRSLEENGWLLVDPRAVAATPEAFRAYVQGSGTEFSVAQGMYVEMESGWFSDRTTRYLASGKPALVQNTGFSRGLPVGEGLVSFRTLDEAAAGAARIAERYEAHCEAARAIAEEHFDSEKVLSRLLAEVGLE